MKKWILRTVILVVVGAVGFGGYRLLKGLESKEQTIPTATVRKGDVVIRSYTRGELRAVRSVMLTAPNLFGTVQITKLAPLGAFAREKNLVVEFDDSEVRSRLEEQQLDLDQVNEQIKKAQAELDIRNNQDQVELLRARYSVRRAELDVKRNELLSSIDAKRNILNLEEAKRRLQQLEVDIKSRLEQSEAELAVLRERRNRANLQLMRERQRLAQVKLLAPMEGLVAVRQSRPMGFFMRGMQLPDLREGDQIFPGTPVADVLDLSEMEVAAKVGELDRANLHEDQEAVMRLDAVPEKTFRGKIKSLSGTASANIWSGDPAKKFDVIFDIDMKQLLTGLGAKPEQIARIMEAAARNRKKPVAATSTSAMSMMGGPGGPGAAMALMQGGPGGQVGAFGGQRGEGAFGGQRGEGGQQGAFGGDRGEGRQRGEGGEGAQAGEGRRGGMRFFGGGDLTEEQQTKLREQMQKLTQGRSIRDMSPEEQTKFREQMAKIFQSVTGRQMPARTQRQGGQGGNERGGREGSPAGEGGPRVMAFARPGGESGGAPGSTQGGMPEGMPMMMPSAFGQQFSEKDLENAELPPPPEATNELDVLLRPGLLADIEIIVEKVPDAIHIPVQAVFEREGKPVVYVKKGDQFEERVIKPLKRSESVMVVAGGVQPGELVALSNPMGTKADTKGKKAEKGKSAGMPGGAGGTGAGGR